MMTPWPVVHARAGRDPADYLSHGMLLSMQTNCWARRRNTRRSARTSTSPSPSWPASRRLGHAAARRTARRFTRAPVVRRCQSSINSLAIAAAAASSSEEKPIPEISLLPNFDRRRRGRFFFSAFNSSLLFRLVRGLFLRGLAFLGRCPELVY